MLMPAVAIWSSVVQLGWVVADGRTCLRVSRIAWFAAMAKFVRPLACVHWNRKLATCLTSVGDLAKGGVETPVTVLVVSGVVSEGCKTSGLSRLWGIVQIL